jgi:hypothetical protein
MKMFVNHYRVGRLGQTPRNPALCSPILCALLLCLLSQLIFGYAHAENLPLVSVTVKFDPAHNESRISPNFTLDAGGQGSEVEWRVNLPPAIRKKFAFALNRDRQGFWHSYDLNLADHLTDGVRTSGDYAEYGARIYLARTAYVDDKGNQLPITKELVEQLLKTEPSVAAALLQAFTSGFTISAYNVSTPQSIRYFGGTGGSPHEIAMPPGWRIASIRVLAGARINQIQINYCEPSGAPHHVEFGQTGGHPNPLFVLDANEHIVAVLGRSGGRLDAIQFVTSKGRKSPMYGGKGGRPFEVFFGDNSELYGLRARSGDEVDCVGFLHRPH